MQGRFKAIVSELRLHAPFTLFGAATGVLAMLLFANASPEVSRRLFQVFHPGHVVLSAIVTASLFRLHERKRGFLAVLLVGYFGAIGVATLSDSVLPFFGESLLGVAIPTHADLHAHEDGHEGAALHVDEEQVHDHASHEDEADPADVHTHEAHDHGSEAHVHEEHEHGHEHAESAVESHDHDAHGHGDGPHIHLGFIEDWYLVNPAALLGVLIAWFWPRTRFPHAGHVLISTWASSFHVLMNTHREFTPTMFVGVFVVLFVAVWLPCCISDIVVPMLFVRSRHLHVGHHHHHRPIKEVQA